MEHKWLWAAALGLLVFLFVQVFPMTGDLFKADGERTLSRGEAAAHARKLAAERFGIPSAQVANVKVTHVADKNASGYLVKEQLTSEYDKKWDASYPVDTYRVDMDIVGDKTGTDESGGAEGDAGVSSEAGSSTGDGAGGTLVLYFHMKTGKLVGWESIGDAHQSTSSFEDEDRESSELADRALAYAGFWGLDKKDWEWSGSVESDGALSFHSRKAPLGEAKLRLTVAVPASFNAVNSSFPEWKSGSVTVRYVLPDSFTAYMDSQEKLASGLSMFAFIVPEIVMFILAIIYAALCSSYTSFVRGIFLSAAFFVIYVIVTINMIPGLRSEMFTQGDGSGSGTIAVVIVSIFIYLGLAGLTYFSAVGGDGLWKSMGFSLWPRWREPEYGSYVVRSMTQGYPLALLLLGAQSLIFVVLEKLLPVFSTTDPSQSTYNMTWPWLLPLLAWCAGISEEIQSRFFGIALFRKWFLGLARLVLRREPSARGITTLTFFAMLPPGLIWALGHVGYAIYPVYTRLIELVILSLLFGWFMLRFGLMTVIFAHVTLDAILMGVQMVFDGIPGDLWAGLFSFVMPALVALVIWWLHRILRDRRGDRSEEPVIV